MLLGKDAQDYDVATDARPEQVIKLFRQVIPTGIKHGTVTVRFKGHSIEVTTFRTEADYGDARRPDSVSFSADIREDLKRRDFTINALALDCRSGRLLDEHGGISDLEGRTIRAIGDPLERFAEDGLRPMRAIRFSSSLGFSIQRETFQAISKTLDRVARVSAERIRDEFMKMLISPRPLSGLRDMEESGLLALILPELARLRGLSQSPPHRFDALDHSFHACQGSAPAPELRLAALFHDIGKPDTRLVREDGTVAYHGHERISALKAERIMKGLKFPNALISSVSNLILNHMTRYDDSWTDAAVRRFVARVGQASVDGILDLLAADEYGLAGAPLPSSRLYLFRDRIESVLKADHALGLKDLAIGGEDLAKIGVRRGKGMGIILNELLDCVLDDPGLNDRERLMEIALKIKEKMGE
jgi:putative nucleotidyltransferase with HDIG domain